MKQIFFLLLAALFISFAGYGQTTKTETFKVYGNCGQCKTTIEGALKKKDGIVKKDWNKDTKMITVTYDSEKITLLQIKQKIAAAGYDSDEVRASEDAYFRLHKCCQYDRPKK
jgi:periplasmic mercuric ion binding protein